MNNRKIMGLLLDLHTFWAIKDRTKKLLNYIKKFVNWDQNGHDLCNVWLSFTINNSYKKINTIM